ncbi:unnamed protein product, partial [Nesidiocoris tenuis]
MRDRSSAIVLHSVKPRSFGAPKRLNRLIDKGPDLIPPGVGPDLKTARTSFSGTIHKSGEQGRKYYATPFKKTPLSAEKKANLP